MKRRAIVLFRGDPRREERQKGLPPRLLSTLHAELERIIRQTPDVDLITASENGPRFELRSSEWSFVSDSEEALSAKIDHSLRVAFDAGYESVVLLAGDIAGLRAEVLEQALDSLEDSRAVLGPSADGGFYLAGFRGYVKLDWSSLPLSTANALAGLESALTALDLNWAVAPRLDDIDSRPCAEAAAQQLRSTRLGRILVSLLSSTPPWSPVRVASLAVVITDSPSRAPPSF